MKKTEIPNKICIFSGDISKGGGTERIGTFLANSLSQSGLFSVSIVSITETFSSPHFFIEPGIPRFRLSSRWIQPGIGYVPLIYRLYRLIRKEKFSVIIDIDHVLDVLSIPCRRFTSISVISWEHFHFHQTLDTWYRPLFHRFSCRYADHIVTLTERDAITYQREGHPRCGVTAIPNAANLLEHSPSSCTKEKQILAIGNLVDRKGFDLLVEVARILVPRFPDWKFYIYGEGEKRQELEALIQRYHLEDHVLLPGYCPDITAEFAKSSIFLLTSESEGLPMVLLEAKYFRLPSVSFDIENGPKEIILDRINGFLIPPFDVNCMADRLAELMDSSELRDSFAFHAWDNIEKFDKTTILQQWIRLLEEIQKIS